MVYGAALEKRWAAMPRGFESHPLRQTREVAGVIFELQYVG